MLLILLKPQLLQHTNIFERVAQFDGFYTDQFEEENALFFYSCVVM